MLTVKEIKSLKQEVNDVKESKVTDVEEKVSTFEIKMNEMYRCQIDPDYVNNSLSELQDKISKM